MGREDTFFKRTWEFNLKGRLFNLQNPVIMGIVNITPDSFYAPSRKTELLDIQNQIDYQHTNGASWIDLGALSTRPGASVLSEHEEENRLLPMLDKLVHTFPDIPFSVDTYRANIARKAVEAGAALVNDVTGGEGDSNMFDTIARLHVPYVLMHARGNAQTMQELTHYNALPDDILTWFLHKKKELNCKGVTDIILDPGIGFAKTIAQNFTLIKHLDAFTAFDLPVLIGISRKSFIYKTLEQLPEDALNGTTALHMACLLNGATVLRVHDAKEASETIRLFNALQQ